MACSGLPCASLVRDRLLMMGVPSEINCRLGHGGRHQAVIVVAAVFNNFRVARATLERLSRILRKRLELVGLLIDTLEVFSRHHLDQDFLRILKSLKKRWVFDLQILLLVVERYHLDLLLGINIGYEARSTA